MTRVVIIGFCFALYIPVAWTITFVSRSPAKDRQLADVNQVLARALLKLLRIEFRVDGSREQLHRLNGPKHLNSGRGCLLVPNHISYIDVLLIQACLPAVFITSEETRAAPGLGFLTRTAGCLFIERRQKRLLHHDINQVAAKLQQGLTVVLFPEGTTTSGLALLPFKSSLLQAALQSRAPVHPVAIRYEKIDGQPFDQNTCDRVAWYGDMTFVPHIRQMLHCHEIVARLSILEAVPFRKHRSRQRLARDIRAILETALGHRSS